MAGATGGIDLETSLGYLLKEAASALRIAMEAVLRPLGLTVTQYSCLELLAQRPGLSNSALARGAFVSRQSMNVLLQGLERDGLVTRLEIAPVGKALPVRLTPLGRRRLGRASAAVRAVERRMLTGLDPTARADARRLLQGFVAGLGAPEDEPDAVPRRASARIEPAAVTTERLTLHPIDDEEGRRIRTRTPRAEDRWAPDYPFDGDLAAVGAFLRASERGEQRPFGYYRIDRREDGVAVGGIGFKGQPREGAVEIGYGLVPSARGRGYATEAVLALVQLARSLGVDVVRADTEPENAASQRVLEKAGFERTAAEVAAVHHEMRITRSAR